MSGAPFWLDPVDPHSPFPDPRLALTEPDGLLAIGGDLSQPRLLNAYRQGIFPWYSEGQPVLWWSPDPRAVIYPHTLHISRSLRKVMRQRRFRLTCDSAFAQVMRACARVPRPGQAGTWITREMEAAYQALHQAGHAHSVEAWADGELVGGLYGIALGGAFFGESMFSRRRDASKVVLATLVGWLGERGGRLLDCQVMNPHLARMGAVPVARETFLGQLGEALRLPDWWQAAPGTELDSTRYAP